MNTLTPNGALHDALCRGYTSINELILHDIKTFNEDHLHAGAKVDLPVLLQKDIDDMDFVAASFVQSKEDVLNIRKVRACENSRRTPTLPAARNTSVYVFRCWMMLEATTSVSSPK
jgi:hypothetical protein